MTTTAHDATAAATTKAALVSMLAESSAAYARRLDTIAAHPHLAGQFVAGTDGLFLALVDGKYRFAGLAAAHRAAWSDKAAAEQVATAWNRALTPAQVASNCEVSVMLETDALASGIAKNAAMVAEIA